MATGGPVRWAVCAAAVAAVAGGGCAGVNRRFVVESNVPTAQVFINDRPVGAAPAHAAFEYYGYYNIKLVHPDCEPLVKRVHVVAPWYAYPPFDLLSVFWPFGVEDVRRYYFELQPAKRTDTGELIMNADKLRERGQSLPTPSPADDGRTLPQSGSGPTPAPQPQPVLPPDIPSVTPSGASPISIPQPQ